MGDDGCGATHILLTDSDAHMKKANFGVCGQEHFFEKHKNKHRKCEPFKLMCFPSLFIFRKEISLSFTSRL
jgi:hypothetical protein